MCTFLSSCLSLLKFFKLYTVQASPNFDFFNRVLLNMTFPYYSINYLLGAWDGRRWRGRQPWGHHHQRNQPCTCRSHCQRREQQRPHQPFWFCFIKLETMSHHNCRLRSEQKVQDLCLTSTFIWASPYAFSVDKSS